LQKTYPLQTCYEHNMLSLLHAVCLKVLVFFYFGCVYKFILYQLSKMQANFASIFGPKNSGVARSF